MSDRDGVGGRVVNRLRRLGRERGRHRNHRTGGVEGGLAVLRREGKSLRSHEALRIVHVVFPSRRGLLPAVRVFIDFLAERLPAVI
jgi:hypothetical protein